MRFWNFAFFSLISLTIAERNLEWYKRDLLTYYTCTGVTLEAATFSVVEYDYSVFCSSEAALASMVGCYMVIGENKTSNYKFWVEQCVLYGVELTMENFTVGQADYEQNAVSVEELGNYTEVTSPILVNTTYALSYFKSYKLFLDNYNNSVYYGAACNGFWALVCIIGAIANWSNILFPNLRNVFNGRISQLWRKYVTLPALVGKKKAVENSTFRYLMFLVPSRLESLVLFLFFWLSFIMNAVEIYRIPNDPIFTSKKEALNRYVADRTGIIAVMLMPILIMFGGRNNFLMWFTRWKFSTFMAYHRWVARLVVLMAFIHSVAYFVLLAMYPDFHEEVTETYVVWGIVAWAVSIIVVFQALLFFRRSCYELFLVLHIVLAAFFVIGCWYHIYDLGYAQMMYAVMAVWAFDRAVRIGRICAFGFPEAEISLVANETIKCVVPKPSYWKPVPGGHAYIRFLTGYKFFQDHPFTYIESENTITFYCKVKNGITKTLYKKLSNLPGKSCQMKVTIEGPYGESSPVKHHSDVVFLAGGNGVPGLFSEFQKLASASDSKQRLKFKWVIRELRSLTWMYQHLRAMEGSQHEIDVYITRPELLEDTEELLAVCSNSDDATESAKESSEEKLHQSDVLAHVKNELPFVNFVEGRPDLATMIDKDIAEANNSIAFITCGNAQMVDEVRHLIVSNIDKTSKRLDVYEAVEVWA